MSGTQATPPAVRAYIGLGSNVGDPERHVRAAIAAIDALSGTRVVARSSLYRTAPIGYREQPDFVNAVVAVDTALAPRALLGLLLALEETHGRVRTFRNAPRSLDLDLLIYADRAIEEKGCVVPHPRMHERAFVLVPLAEIAPDAMVPGRGRVADLLRAVPDSGVAKTGA